ncbi:hypothetical protein B0T20DRAFT_421258 [Sordaria brevicollis]|uniref:Uncharacterized protein n=1 Tax=Sordaria brevicollis TaxID=83679 RepID=A0AAE0P2Z1_SORBR|nr:hypothetical protein B0T20DRAFT_421258 [Sordaria brevicollis]
MIGRHKPITIQPFSLSRAFNGPWNSNSWFHTRDGNPLMTTMDRQAESSFELHGNNSRFPCCLAASTMRLRSNGGSYPILVNIVRRLDRASGKSPLESLSEILTLDHLDINQNHTCIPEFIPVHISLFAALKTSNMVVRFDDLRSWFSSAANESFHTSSFPTLPGPRMFRSSTPRAPQDLGNENVEQAPSLSENFHWLECTYLQAKPSNAKHLITATLKR